MNRLIKIRIRQKRKKPEFLRQEYYTHPKRLGRKWRQPMGRTSKLRYKEKSRGSQPSMGYGSPAAVRGLSRFGYKLVRVANVQDLSKVTDTKAMMAEIAGGVGNKKKAEIVRIAKEKSILIFNRPKKSIDKVKRQPKPDKKEEKKEARKEDKTKEKPKEQKKEEHKPLK